MLAWSRDELAARSGVARQTLADFETDKRSPYDRTLADVRRTFEEAGILFLPAEIALGPGLRLAAVE